MKTSILVALIAAAALVLAAYGLSIAVPVAVAASIGAAIVATRIGRAPVAGFVIIVLLAAAFAMALGAFAIADTAILIALCSALAMTLVPENRGRRPFRILLVTRHIAPDVGGTETFIADFLKFTSERGVEVHVVALQPLGGRIEPPSHTTLHYIAWKPLVRLLWDHRETRNPLLAGLLFCAASLSLAVRTILLVPFLRPNVIYAVGGPIAAASGTVVKSLTGVPLAIHFHRMYQWSARSQLVRAIIASVYRYADCVIGNSVMIELDAAQLRVSAAKVVGISNWVDKNVFYPRNATADLRRKWGVPDDKAVLLFTGLFDPIKHVDRIISALRLVNEPRVLFLFAGHGPLEQEVASLNREGCEVRVLGMCNHEELAELANLSDVHFWGSVDVKYPGLVVMEAMMCGAPEVTTSVTMNDRWDGDAIVDATSFGAPQFAWTFAPTDSGIAEAVHFVADNVADLRMMRPRVAAFAQEAFGIKNAERLLARLYTIGHGSGTAQERRSAPEHQ